MKILLTGAAGYVGSASLRHLLARGCDAFTFDDLPQGHAKAVPDGAHGEDHDRETHLIPLVLQTALGAREELLVFGDGYPTPDGTCVRDYIHVDDLAQAHLLAVRATTPDTQETYNVGAGAGHSVLEIIAACETVVGEKIPYRVVARRPGDEPALVASPQRQMTALGWRPNYTSLQDVVRTAWRWQADHPDDYGSTVPSEGAV